MEKGDEIIVTWELPAESSWGAQAGSGHKWHQEKLPPTPPALPNLTEATLGFSTGTMQVLERAFSLGLTRAQTWNAANLSPAWQEAIWDAAKIFKRGVPVFPPRRAAPKAVSTGLSSPRSHPSSKGSYTIRLSDSWQEMLLQQGAARPLIIADLALTARLENPAWDIHFVSWVETDKNLETVAALAQTLQQFQSRKHKGLNSIVAIGGGLLLDLVGFAAGLLGLKVTYVPTTVLAMIDAGIGGKTAVNHPTYGKNQLGLFCQPQEVILDCSFLSSLPARQWNAGLVEGIKHALLMRDEPMLAALWRMKPNSEALKPWLLPILNVKAKIVEKDPWELGERAVLNLGHTIGHALENFSEHKFLHGEAVLIGLIVDVHFSHQQGGLDQKQLQSTLADLRQVVAESLGPMTSNHKAFFLELLSLFSNPGRWKATLGPLLAQDKKKLLVDDHEIPMIQLDWVNSPATNRITHALVTRVPFAALDIPLKESAHFLNSVLFQPS